MDVLFKKKPFPAVDHAMSTTMAMYVPKKSMVTQSIRNGEQPKPENRVRGLVKHATLVVKRRSNVIQDFQNAHNAKDSIENADLTQSKFETRACHACKSPEMGICTNVGCN